MATPQGPRGSGNNRGRARSRGTYRVRGGRNEILEEQQSNRRTSQSTRGSDSLSSKARITPPRQNEGRGSKQRPREAAPPPAHRNRTQRFPPTSPAPSVNPQDMSWRNPVVESLSSYQRNMFDLYQTMKKNREQERKDSIKNGTLSDPDKPTSLKNAIKIVGTCRDMCPEFERVERIVQMMVDGAEKTISQSNAKVPEEKQMVKRFRRSAAGYDEQLPSDIRPPKVLQTTLNYLFNEVIARAQLATVHKFVWDRTRSIRNDFSIQRVTKLDDLKIAIDCFERIARFHILSLHQLSRQDEDNGEFDHYQEREQLNNTLLSLMYYYDDSRPILTSANEAEFRAYCIIFEIQSQRPDLEHRIQDWPRSLVLDERVKTALEIYAAAGNASDEQGPLRPRSSYSSAQAKLSHFWALVQSNSVPYLMACVAELYFNFIRTTALETIWTAYRIKRPGRQPLDWSLDDLTLALGFDTENQTRAFCEDHGFSFVEKETGKNFVDLGSVTGKYLADSNSRRKQVFSQTLVEPKRLGRTLPAVINGLSVSKAQAEGLIQDPTETVSSSGSNQESLFITGHSDEETQKKKRETLQAEKAKSKHESTQKTAGLDPRAQPFVPPTLVGTPSNPFAKVGMFGVPSPLITVSQPGDPSATSKPATPDLGSSNPLDKPVNFNFWPNKTVTNDNSTPSPNTTPLAAPSVQKPEPTEGPPSAIFKIPSPFQTDPEAVNPFSGAGDESSKPPSGPISTPPSPKTTEPSPKITLVPSAQATEPSKSISNLFQPPIPPATTKTTTATQPLFNWPISSETYQASQSDQKVASLPDLAISPTIQESNSPFGFLNEPPATKESSSQFEFLNQPPKPEESGSPFAFLNEPRETKESSNPFAFLNDPAIPPTPSMTDASQKASIYPLHNDTSSSAGPSKLSSHSAPPPIIPRAPKRDLIHRAMENSKKSHVLASNLANAEQLPSLPELNQHPLTPGITRAEQAKVGPPKPIPRPAVLEDLSTSLMLDQNGLLNQFVDHTLASVVTGVFHQVKDGQSWERAGEVRAILLSKKYFKKWKRIAWARGLRRSRDERRKLAQSMREKARNSPQQQADLGISLPVNESGRNHQETTSMASPSRNKRKSLPNDPELHPQQIAEMPLSKKQKRETSMAPPLRHKQKSLLDDLERHSEQTAEMPLSKKQSREISMAPPSRKKRKSLPIELDSQQTAETPPCKKQKSDERVSKAQLSASRRIENHHRRSKTLETPISSSRLQTLSNSLYSFPPDFSHLGDGSILSHSVLQKARHLVPSVKIDTTRTDYFLLKSLGIDPDTTLVPRTSRKRPRDEPHPEGIKIRKPSPPEAYSHATGKSSANCITSSLSARDVSDYTNGITPSTSAQVTNNFANNIRPSTSATSSSTKNVQLSRSVPAPSANDEYDSDEALFAEARAVREALKQDVAWYRAEREKSRLSFDTSSSSGRSKKHHVIPRIETEKERRLREFKRTPSRTEQRLKATKANGFLPVNWNGFEQVKAVNASTKAAISAERGTIWPVTAEDERIKNTGWDEDEESSEEYGDGTGTGTGLEQHWGYADAAKGNLAGGSSFEDAIEL